MQFQLCYRSSVAFKPADSLRRPLVRLCQPAACRATVRATGNSSDLPGVQHTQQQQQQQQPIASSRQHVAAAAAGAGASLLVLLQAGAAWAEEEISQYSYPAQDDPVITVLFTVAIGLLSVVTLGVIYLATLSFFDNRQETKDKETGGVTSLAEQREEAKLAEKERQAEKKRARRVVDKSKGFGQ